MPEHILFLTGKLARPSLARVLEEMQPTPFTYEIREMGVSVAALLTGDLITRRLSDIGAATRVMLPGRCRADIAALSARYGVPFSRGPDELKDLPEHFGGASRRAALDRHDVMIFAEIVDAPDLTVEEIMKRAAAYRRDGADVIDLGALPETPFDHLAEAVQALKASGFQVSVDSLDVEFLRIGGRAGADYLLSLKEETLWLMDEVASTPILIATEPADSASLDRCIAHARKMGRAFFADPILEPIHFGFTESIIRYAEMRKRDPDAPILMGVGNLTELTDADTAGINALLFGIISELGIGAVLTTQVGAHARRAVKEADVARRMMFAAREARALPRKFTSALLGLHEAKPFPDSEDEIRAIAAAIKDPSFRVQASDSGVHVFNRDGFHTASDPFDLWPALGLEADGAHAFYMGVELARAQIAHQLGKRYTQDEELGWGCAVDRADENVNEQKTAGTTLAARKHRHTNDS